MIRETTGPSICFYIVLTVTSAYAQSDNRECEDALARTLSAFQRAERSLARTRVAGMRVAHELNTEFHLNSSEPSPAVQNAALSTEVALERIALATWELKKLNEGEAEEFVKLVSDRQGRATPLPAVGGDIPETNEQVLMLPVGERAQDCANWARYGELGALRAEQAAQLSEIAMEQAIAISGRFFGTLRGRPQ